jgi:hypothetical protein
MKTFVDYLAESKQTFQYRIKIAGELDKDKINELETRLERYDLIKMSEPKKTPVMKSPAGFPELKNEEVHIIDVEFSYPAATQEVTEMWRQLGGDPDHIRIMTPEYDDSVTAEEERKEESPVLDKEYPTPPDAEYDTTDEVIKNSASDAKFEIAGGKTEPAKTTNDLEQGTDSAIPGTNKRPTPKSHAR